MYIYISTHIKDTEKDADASRTRTPNHSSHTHDFTIIKGKYMIRLRKISNRNSVVLTMNSYKMCKKMSDHDRDV